MPPSSRVAHTIESNLREFESRVNRLKNIGESNELINDFIRRIS
jgi:hypothetical protein